MESEPAGGKSGPVSAFQTSKNKLKHVKIQTGKTIKIMILYQIPLIRDSRWQ